MENQSSWQDKAAHSNGLADQAKDAVSQVAGAARESVGSQVDSQKGKLVEHISGVAQALRETGTRLSENEPTSFAASYVDKAASQADRLADYFEGRDLSDIVGEVQDLARREPAAFFGGLFALGLVTGRFLKSTSRSKSDRSPGALGAAARTEQGAAWRPEQGAASRPEQGAAWRPDQGAASRPGQGAVAQPRSPETSDSKESGPKESGASAPSTAAGAMPPSTSKPLKSELASGAPIAQAKPEVIGPAAVRESGSEEGHTGAQGASSTRGAGEASASTSRGPRGSSSPGTT